MFKVAHQAIRDAISNMAFNSAALAIGDTTSRIQTTAALNFAINGVIYAKDATNNIELVAVNEDGSAGTLTAQAAGTKRMYLVVINASGDVRIVQGEAVASSALAPLPTLPPNMAPVGALRVVNGTEDDFVPGTTAFNASDITTTYYNLQTVPVASF